MTLLFPHLPSTGEKVSGGNQNKSQDKPLCSSPIQKRPDMLIRRAFVGQDKGKKYSTPEAEVLKGRKVRPAPSALPMRHIRESQSPRRSTSPGALGISRLQYCTPEWPHLRVTQARLLVLLYLRRHSNSWHGCPQGCDWYFAGSASSTFPPAAVPDSLLLMRPSLPQLLDGFGLGT